MTTSSGRERRLLGRAGSWEEQAPVDEPHDLPDAVSLWNPEPLHFLSRNLHLHFIE